MTSSAIEVGHPVSDYFEDFYTRYYGLAIDVAQRVCQDLDHTTDSLQEAFTQMWQRRMDYDPSQGSLATWVGIYAHRRAVDTVRREESQKRRASNVGAELAVALATGLNNEDVEETACRNVYTGELPRLLETVTPAQREALVYMAIGMTHVEIAQHTGVALGTIKSRLHSAVVALRHKVGSNEESMSLPRSRYNKRMLAQQLVEKYPRVSDQVSKEQLAKTVDELQLVLEKQIEGSVVEFGCYIGTTSLFIKRLLDINQDKREFHVYDSFQGLPEKTAPDESPAGQQFKAGELMVGKKLFQYEFQRANLELPTIHKAWFNDLKPADVPEKIAFAFLDGDFYESIRDSLRLVLPRMQPGGTIIIDDYSREALPGVAQAVREFLPPALHMRLRVVNNQAIIRL